MRVESGAGEFEITVAEVTAEDGMLVLRGKMGIWDSRTLVTAEDMSAILRASLNRASIWHLVRSMPSVIRGVFRREGSTRR